MFVICMECIGDCQLPYTSSGGIDCYEFVEVSGDCHHMKVFVNANYSTVVPSDMGSTIASLWRYHRLAITSVGIVGWHMVVV
jgi:hypothetical protein